MAQGDTVAADKGVHGARLGPEYAYQWVDQVPTAKSWEDLAKRRGCLFAALAVPIWACGGWLLGGPFGFACGLLLSFWTLPIALQTGEQTAGRGDKEPVPRPVAREAFIEYANGDFYFVVTDDGRARIWQPWDQVRTFEHADYWATFGDAGASPYKTGWHAIMMTPAVGAPWCIVSTIEGMSEVRERHSFLNAKFGADARERFRRALAQKQGSTGQGDGQSGSPRGGSDVPARFE